MQGKRDELRIPYMLKAMSKMDWHSNKVFFKKMSACHGWESTMKKVAERMPPDRLLCGTGGAKFGTGTIALPDRRVRRKRKRQTLITDYFGWQRQIIERIEFGDCEADCQAGAGRGGRGGRFDSNYARKQVFVGSAAPWTSS